MLVGTCRPKLWEGMIDIITVPRVAHSLTVALIARFRSQETERVIFGASLKLFVSRKERLAHIARDDLRGRSTLQIPLVKCTSIYTRNR